MKAILTALALCLVLPSCNSASADDAKSNGQTSTAIIQILPTTPVLTDPALRTDNFIANEIASLSMGVVIKEAVEEMDWTQRGHSEKSIRDSLKVERLPGTDMARITASDSEPGVAKEIVASIIVAYANNRKRIEVGMSEKALDNLDNELIVQSDLVQDHRKDLTVLIQQYGIPYFDTQSHGPLGQIEAEMFAQSRRNLATIDSEKALLTGKIKATRDNPTENKKLLAQLKILTAQSEELGEIAADRRDDTIDLSLNQIRYMQAARTYERSSNLLNQMKIKQQESRVALKMPLSPLIIRQNPE